MQYYVDKLILVRLIKSGSILSSREVGNKTSSDFHEHRLVAHVLFSQLSLSCSNTYYNNLIAV